MRKIDIQHLKPGKTRVIIVLLVLLFASVCLSLSLGHVQISLSCVAEAVLAPNKASSCSVGDLVIVRSIRFPRIFVAILVGAGLSVAGAGMQGLFRNPMADPYIVGISAGAALGASIGFVFHLHIMFVSLVAFTAAMCTSLLVYSLARVGGHVPVRNLLLAGIAVGYFLSAITMLIMFLARKEVQQIVFWLMGSLSTSDWTKLQYVLPVSALGGVGVYTHARELNILQLGEEQALSLGIDVEKTKRYVLIFSSLITASSVAISGVIGFIGLVTPHMVRLLVGPNHKVLIPCSALLGAVLLLWSDTIARTIIPPVEIPVGVVTALGGGPFFVYLLRRGKR